MTQSSDTAQSRPTLILGFDSYVSHAELEGYWVLAPSPAERVQFTNCRLIDCDLSQTDWGNYDGCVIIGGTPPLGGSPEDAKDCTVTGAQSAGII